MKKNGFTLVEIIVTLGIMALIGVVIAGNFSGLFSEQEDKDYEAFVKQIEDSACMYVETAFTANEKSNCRKNTCTITVDKLVGRGYLDEELVDPSTGDKVMENQSKYKVTVSWPNNVKTCKMNEE